MKKLYIPLMLLGLVSFWSCEDENLGPVAELNSNPVLNELADNNIIVSADNASTKIATITWAEADYNYSAAINYKVEIDKAGNNFANAVEIATTTENSVSLTGTELNDLLSQVGAFPTISADYELKVTSTIHEAVESAVSKDTRSPTPAS